MKITDLNKVLNESEGHKPMSAMPTEELKQIMRDETDKESSRYMAAKHIILQRRTQNKESVKTEGVGFTKSGGHNKLMVSKLKLCAIMCGHIEKALTGHTYGLNTGNLTSEDVDQVKEHLAAAAKVLMGKMEID